MTKVTEVPGIPTIGSDYRDPDITKVLSIGDEAMIIVDNATGQMTIHPKTVAFGDSEHGQLMVPGWRGTVGYQRGQGDVTPNEQYGWRGFCFGDRICQAIAEGRIPVYSVDDLPESHRRQVD